VVAVIGQENILQAERAELVRRVCLYVTPRSVLCSRRLCAGSYSELHSSSAAVAILINPRLSLLLLLLLVHFLLISSLFFPLPCRLYLHLFLLFYNRYCLRFLMHLRLAPAKHVDCNQ
jgi:hypothetical protein